MLGDISCVRPLYSALEDSRTPLKLGCSDYVMIIFTLQNPLAISHLQIL